MIDLSSYADTLNGKPIAVFGLGISGLSAVRALVSAGIEVTAWDDNKDSCDKARDLGAVIEDLTKIDLSGFAALLLAPGVPYSFEPHAVVVNAQNAGIEIIGDLELLHRANHGVKVIGITGTNGKSTTTALMAHVLNECGLKVVMGGNIGKAVFDIDMTQGVDVLVLEISSYQMDLCPTFRPDISILLNITPDHLDRHGSMDAYIKAKAKILEGKGVAIISVDDDFTQKLFDETFCQGNRKVIPVSMKSEITEGFFVNKGVLFENARGENKEVGLLNRSEFENLKGLHNYQNASCVLVTARKLGVEDKDVFEAFKTYPGLLHRQYLVTKKNKVTYINDSKATNAEAAAKALSSYDGIYWIVGGRSKEMGLEGLEIFKSKIIKTYVIGEASKEFSAWLQHHGFGHELCKTLDIATQKAHEEAQALNEPAVVLLSPACASWDQYSSFEVRGQAFTDQVNDLTRGE